MSNAIKLAPLLTPEEALRIASMPRPRLMRSTNGYLPLTPSDIPIPRLMRATNTPVVTPSPRTPSELPPVLTRADERRRVTPEEIEEAARRLW